MQINNLYSRIVKFNFNRKPFATECTDPDNYLICDVETDHRTMEK